MKKALLAASVLIFFLGIGTPVYAEDEITDIQGHWLFSLQGSLPPTLAFNPNKSENIYVSMAWTILRKDGIALRKAGVLKAGVFITSVVFGSLIDCFPHTIHIEFSDGKKFNLVSDSSCHKFKAGDTFEDGVSYSLANSDRENVGTSIENGAFPVRIVDGIRKINLCHHGDAQSIQRFSHEISPQHRPDLYDVLHVY